MSQEREVLEVKSTAAKIDHNNEQLVKQRITTLEKIEELTDSQTIELAQLRAVQRAKRKAKLLHALDRGVVHDRLNVMLPDDLHGEWIRNDPLEIHRMETLGFRVDTEYATKRSIHNDGSGRPVIGDAVFMVCDKEVKDIIEEIRTEKFNRIHGKSTGREEQEYADVVSKGTGGDIGAFTESAQREARKADIADALATLQKQTQPARG